MSETPNVGILWESKLCGSCVSVKHMMSLFSNLLSDSKSTACLLRLNIK